MRRVGSEDSSKKQSTRVLNADEREESGLKVPHAREPLGEIDYVAEAVEQHHYRAVVEGIKTGKIQKGSDLFAGVALQASLSMFSKERKEQYWFTIILQAK